MQLIWWLIQTRDCARPSRVTIYKKLLVKEAVQNMLKPGIIERSVLSWRFSIVVVDKKDGGHRFCVNFRKLNAISKPWQYHWSCLGKLDTSPL